MTYDLVRNTTITNARALGTAYDIVDEETRSIGVVAEGGPGWRVHSAGPAVPVDQNIWHGNVNQALDALLAARAAAEQEGGMLHVDESGLTGFQRAVLDFAGLRYIRIGTRTADIWARFDMHPAVYTQHLLSLLETREAAAYAPQIVSAQRRIRDQRRASRTSGRAS
jgi:hypothetical protein